MSEIFSLTENASQESPEDSAKLRQSLEMECKARKAHVGVADVVRGVPQLIWEPSREYTGLKIHPNGGCLGFLNHQQ